MVVTNCLQQLAEFAAIATGCEFDVVMSAERAGWYKVQPQAYQAGLDALGFPANRVLFVAGSAHYVSGARSVRMDVYWSNRQALPVPCGSVARFNAPDLSEPTNALDI